MKKNKNDKGFTMIELIASIVILTMIFGIGAAALINILDNSKEDSYMLQISEIKNAAINYAADRTSTINAGESFQVTLQELNDDGKIELPIQNPRNGKNFDPSSVIITVKKEANSNFTIDVTDNTVY